MPGIAISLISFAVLLLTACNLQDAETQEDPPLDDASITSVWHKAKLRGVAFRAIGQEPAWLLEITDGKEIMLSTDYGQDVRNYPHVEPVVYQDQRRTLYVIDNKNIEIEILGQPCRDAMSGEEFAVSVTITLTDRELEGCGRALY